MLRILKKILADKERKAKLLFWVWLVSLMMIVLGYIIIFFMLFKKS